MKKGGKNNFDKVVAIESISIPLSNNCFLCQGPVDDITENTADDMEEGLEEGTQEAGKDRSHFFGHPVFLTVSGQLHLEAITG